MSSKQISVNLSKKALNRLNSTNISKKYSIKLPKYYKNSSSSSKSKSNIDRHFSRSKENKR